jgi:hypothetical protein
LKKHRDVVKSIIGMARHDKVDEEAARSVPTQLDAVLECVAPTPMLSKLEKARADMYGIILDEIIRGSKTHRTSTSLARRISKGLTRGLSLVGITAGDGKGAKSSSSQIDASMDAITTPRETSSLGNKVSPEASPSASGLEGKVSPRSDEEICEEFNNLWYVRQTGHLQWDI